MNATLRRITISAALILPLTFCAQAQSSQGNISIGVEDAETEVKLKESQVILYDSNGQKLQELQTDSQGKLIVEDLPLGDYVVEIKKSGYDSEKVTLRVQPDQTTSYESLLLQLDGTETVIEVKDSKLLMDALATGGASTTRRSQKFLRDNLTDQNEFNKVLASVPGVQINSNGQAHVRGEHKAISYTIDGLRMPTTLSSNALQPIDPSFIDAMDLQTGAFSASQGGQGGLVVNAVTPWISEEITELSGEAGNSGWQGRFMTQGSNDDQTFAYRIGARYRETELAFEPISQEDQTLHNHGTTLSLLTQLKGQSEDRNNSWNLTLSYQDTKAQVPSTRANYLAGVRNNFEENNLLAAFSWNTKIDEHQKLKMGIAYSRSNQSYRNSGVFTPYNSYPEALHEELGEENFPLNPENPGSPYLPTTDLSITQITPQVDYTLILDKERNELVQIGANANFTSTDQSISIIDAGGGGGLPLVTGVTSDGYNQFAREINRDGFLGGLYIQHQKPLSDNLMLNYGLRAETYNNGLTQEGQISPNIALAWALSDTQSLRLSYNRLFQPPPLEIDISGLTSVRPQRTHAYELSYQTQLGKNILGKASLVHKEYTNQVDTGLLIANTPLPLYAPVNFNKARYQGLELGIETDYDLGWNGFLSATLSEAKPLEIGPYIDEEPEYNDHDQRLQVTGGLSYKWDKGVSVNFDGLYASGYPQEALPLYNEEGIRPFGYEGERISRFVANVGVNYFPQEQDFKPSWGVGVKVLNVFDDRSMINFYSEFSGTRFQKGREYAVHGSLKW